MTAAAAIDFLTPDAVATDAAAAQHNGNKLANSLSITIRKIIFHDAAEGAIIAAGTVASDGDATATPREAVIKGQIDGDEDTLRVGTTYTVYGEWTDHEKHGEQFAFWTVAEAQPSTRLAITKYLASHAPHVGAARAARLWEHFGPDAVAVLRTDPMRVAAAGILKDAEAVAAAEALTANAEMESVRIGLFELFHGRGFSSRLIAACIARWGAKAVAVVRRSPYRLLLASLPSCGFKRTDKLYMDLGGRAAALKRQALAAWATLRGDTTGNTWMLAGAARKGIIQTVGAKAANVDKAIRLAIKLRLIETRRDERDVIWVAERNNARAEAAVARHLTRLRGTKNDIAFAWPSCDDLHDAGQLSEHQLHTIWPILSSRVAILAGSPGTGKTFVAAAIIREIVKRYGTDAIKVAAPTGKAAVRITEAMRRCGVNIGASTIHRLLGVRGGGEGVFEHNAENTLPIRVLVIEEMSMLDTTLAAHLFSALDTGTHVLCLGDPGQLAPVGHGAPLRDMIAAGVPCGLLTEIQRNAGMIVRACAAIKDGKRFETTERYDEATGANLKWVECQTAEHQVATLQRLLAGVKASGRFDPIWDVQVLCARNENSPVSRVELNATLQRALNPAEAARDATDDGQRLLHRFRCNDKIICLKNCWLSLYGLDAVVGLDATEVANYVEVRDGGGVPEPCYLANGEIGRVVAVGPKVVIATFQGPPRTVRIPTGKGDAAEADGGGTGERGEKKSGGASDFALAYAVTTHKSQGSEWPLVVCMIDQDGGFVCSREFHYTAISRASRCCVCIGKRAALDKQVRRVALRDRKTFLVELLKGAAS